MAPAPSRKHLAKIGLALVLLNEARGVCVVIGILLAAHGRVF